MAPARRLALVAAVLGALSAPAVALALEQPIDAAKLVIRRSAAGKEKLVFVSRDPRLVFPPAGGPDDPTAGGVRVELFSPSEPEGVALTVPPGRGKPGWTTRPGLYKFIN